MARSFWGSKGTLSSILYGLWWAAGILTKTLLSLEQPYMIFCKLQVCVCLLSICGYVCLSLMSFLVRYFPAIVFPLPKVRERERERERRHQLQPVNFNPLLKRMLKIHGYSEQKDSSAKAFTAHQLHKSNIRKNPVGQPWVAFHFQSEKSQKLHIFFRHATQSSLVLFDSCWKCVGVFLLCSACRGEVSRKSKWVNSTSLFSTPSAPSYCYWLPSWFWISWIDTCGDQQYRSARGCPGHEVWDEDAFESFHEAIFVLYTSSIASMMHWGKISHLSQDHPLGNLCTLEVIILQSTRHRTFDEMKLWGII